MHLIIFLVSLAHYAHTHSVFYDIPSYYGHFSYNYFEVEQLLNKKMTLLQYHFAADATYDNQTIYFAQQAQHCIYKYTASTGKVNKFAGNCGIPGNIIGSISNSEFNGVSSVAYFKAPSKKLLEKISNQSIYIVANASCSILDPSCIIDKSMLIYSPPPKTIPPPNTNIFKIQSASNIRIVPQISLYQDQQGQAQFLYVADTNNHCIKKIQLTTNQVQVVAGLCGNPGFLDGPLKYNRVSFPRNLGISRQGVLYFFDSGNEYIRIVMKNGIVKTLLLGACKQCTYFDIKDRTGRTILNYKLKQILCYQSWIEEQTQSSINHYFDSSILNVCTNQSSQCTSSQ